jgi:hypothetical protein
MIKKDKNVDKNLTIKERAKVWDARRGREILTLIVNEHLSDIFDYLLLLFSPVPWTDLVSLSFVTSFL